ncbi:hypothetical protein ACFL2Q_07010 [Thermodesulfobacteriota bacterium]
MNKTLATAVLIIIEAGIEELAERIKNRRKKDGSNHHRNLRGVYDLCDRSAAHFNAVDPQRAVKRKRGRRRSISWERQNTKKGVRNNERTKHVSQG